MKATRYIAGLESQERIARDQRDGRLHYLMAQGKHTSAELAEACGMARDDAMRVAEQWAIANKWPWPPTLDHLRSEQR